MSAQWVSLQSCPTSPTSNYVVLGDKSILTAPDTSNGRAKGILIYKASSKKWKVLIQYPESLRSTNHTLAYDEDNHWVCLYGEESLIHGFSVPTGFSSKSSYKVYDGKSFGVDVKSGASMLIIDKNVHIIGGETNTKHFMWKKSKSPLWQEIYHFDTLKSGNKNNGVVCLKNKGMIINFLYNVWSNILCVICFFLIFVGLIYVFGGHDGDKGDLGSIWEYTVSKNKWRLLDIRMPFKMSSFGVFPTHKEKYIVFFGGESNGKLMDNILIFDTVYTSFKLSTYKCPVAAKFHAVLMPNNAIHLFTRNDGRHWTIPLQKIVNGKLTNLAAKYEDDEDEQKLISASAPELDEMEMKSASLQYGSGSGPGSLEMKSQSPEKEMTRNKLVNLHLNNALNDINKALLIVKQNGNDGNKQEIDFTANIAKLQSVIDELMQFKHVDVLQYKIWTLDQMVLWISQIENGRFCKYIEVLKNGFIALKIDNGSELPDINSLMLKKPPFNIQDGKDRDDLVKYFASLGNVGANVEFEYGGTINEGGNDNVNANHGEGEGVAETAGGNMVYI